GKTYESHTPGAYGKEVLEFFSTTLLDGSEDAKATMKRLLPMLEDHHGTVIELERVMGIVEPNGARQWSEIKTPNLIAIYPDEVGFDKSVTKPVEVHFAFEIPKDRMPSNDGAKKFLSRLRDGCNQVNIRVGGWFLFEKSGSDWAYRSNMFADR